MPRRFPPPWSIEKYTDRPIKQQIETPELRQPLDPS
jgi:hypothetical protein